MDKPIAVGATAEIYAWENGQILKLFRPRFSAQTVEREARIARLIHGSGAPVPAVGEVVEIDGRVGLLYERIAGVSMLAALAAQPWRLASFARQLAELQAGLHANAAPDGLPIQRERMGDKIRGAQVAPVELRQRALALLDNLPAGRQLCHGDFHPDNVLLTERGPVIIDWIDATAGYPLADVARSSVLIYFSQPAEGVEFDWKVRLLRYWFHKIYLAHYRRLHPFAEDEFARWRLVNAAARLSENVPEEESLLALL
ncbi:MAG: phosphotransferase [Chloroflexi bacterium]|nr:phosphotransferase [Chloroflexota bacterium]